MSGTKIQLDILTARDQRLAFLHELIAMAIAALQPHRIILFGSRARGDNAPTSDVDLAFEFPQENLQKWGAFCGQVKEDCHTLLDLDLVNSSEADPKLLGSISREGIVIYESH